MKIATDQVKPSNHNSWVSWTTSWTTVYADKYEMIRLLLTFAFMFSVSYGDQYQLAEKLGFSLHRTSHLLEERNFINFNSFSRASLRLQKKTGNIDEERFNEISTSLEDLVDIQIDLLEHLERIERMGGHLYIAVGLEGSEFENVEDMLFAVLNGRIYPVVKEMEFEEIFNRTTSSRFASKVNCMIKDLGEEGEPPEISPLDKGYLLDDEYFDNGAWRSKSKLQDHWMDINLDNGVVEFVPGENLSIDLGKGVLMEFVWIHYLGLWIGKFEVTNAEFRRLRSDHDSGDHQGHTLDSDRQPVVRITYEEVIAFIKWLNLHPGISGTTMRARLLTGEEWTAIARCGMDREFPWGNYLPPSRGNYFDQTAYEQLDASFMLEIAADLGVFRLENYDDGFAVTAPVEKSGKNEWGLFGVGGNVWEFTSEEDGHAYAARGGSWITLPDGLRIEDRRSSFPWEKSPIFGFRVVIAEDTSGQ